MTPNDNSNSNTEPSINDFTLGDLMRMAGDTPGSGLTNECIVATTDSRMQAFRFPCRIDAYIIGVGTEGETRQTFNLREYRLHKDSMFIFPPRNILHQEQGEGHFKAHLIILSTQLVRRVRIDTKNLVPLLLKFSARPCLELTPAESQSVRNYISTIEKELKAPKTEFTDGIIEGLTSALFYKVGTILQHYLAIHPEKERPVQNRTEEYFRRFMALLSEHYLHERSVGFYARQLCITPKYLTTMIKQISGKSASEWIDSYVILEAKTLLKYSHKSIQEIAYYLNFPNQSFFGSYFKRNTGMSPSQYKAAR